MTPAQRRSKTSTKRLRAIEADLQRGINAIEQGKLEYQQAFGLKDDVVRLGIIGEILPRQLRGALIVCEGDDSIEWVLSIGGRITRRGELFRGDSNTDILLRCEAELNIAGVTIRADDVIDANDDEKRRWRREHRKRRDK